MKPKTTPKRTSRWAGKCDCGQLGNKVGGIISCVPCLIRDARGGFGIQICAGVSSVEKRGSLNLEIA